MKENNTMKPFLKWVGGKTQLLNELIPRMPQKFNNYFEAFVGGGALLFKVKPHVAYINDFNEELINTYKTIKENPEELILDLKKHKNEETYFYDIRSWDREKGFKKRSKVERASRLIYLNKTCFNGLYRVNSQGFYNSPFGKYKNPLICDERNIRTVSAFLKNVHIENNDFEVFLEKTIEGDFVYLDPPYDTLSETASFTSYNAGGFGKEEQIRLKRVCDNLTKKGVFWMLSNANTDFIRNLYKDYKIDVVYAKRSINSNGNKRGNVEEVIIRNYE